MFNYFVCMVKQKGINVVICIDSLIIKKPKNYKHNKHQKL